MELLHINWTNTLTVVGFGFIVVIIILTLLILLLLLFEKSMSFFVSKKNHPSKKKKNTALQLANQHSLSGDEVAAISMALHLYFDDVHDFESNVIKIKRVERRYSPWSSKIHGLNNFQK